VSTLGRERVKRAELHLPRYGTAWARVETVENAVPAGPATLTLRDLALVGTVLPARGGLNSPSSWVGIWVNGAGWDTVLPTTRPPYHGPAGVRLRSVLSDLAVDCGNLAIVLPTDAIIGPHWLRHQRGADRKPRTGRDELAALVRARHIPTWYADALDVTRFATRTSGAVTATVRVLSRDLDRGRRVVGTESPAAFVPGATFEGATIERVVVREDESGLTLETWEA
jgi:hypothetical protein